MFSHANPCVCVMVNTIGESFGIDSKYSTTHWETNIANCCDYPSFHFTCLFPDKFVSWHLATSQWTIKFLVLYCTYRCTPMSRLGDTVGGGGGRVLPPVGRQRGAGCCVWGPETGTELDHSPGGVLARHRQHPHYRTEPRQQQFC